MDDNSEDPTEEVSRSVDEMFQHLDEAKQRDETPRSSAGTGSGRRWSKKARMMQRRSDAAVLASNHEPRLRELEELDKVTHRAGKPWTSAKAGVEAQGRIHIYYRMDGMVTHTGYITRIVIRPDDEFDVPQVIREHITDDDTYSDYSDKYDVTTFLVTDGERLDKPFPQSELERLEGGEYVSEDFSYQPAYVRQRSGDFPEF